MPLRNVLYVEDDAVNILVMQGIVELRPGCQLHVAGTGAEACAFVARQPVDLVLYDMHLPDVTGAALLAQLRTGGLAPHVPAVLVTAESQAEAAELASQGGFDGCWTKPLDVPATLQQLAHWLG